MSTGSEINQLKMKLLHGSEFMAEFEVACEEMAIPLVVLPSGRPTYNGGVERGNRTFREEFYYRCDLLADSIGAMRFELKKALNKYNTWRPHKSWGGLTPMVYILKTCSGIATESQTTRTITPGKIGLNKVSEAG